MEAFFGCLYLPSFHCRELIVFKNLQSARSGYYRQLKKIEISVTPSTWNKPAEEVLSVLEKAADDWKKRIAVETQKVIDFIILSVCNRQIF